jgi:Uma2 family endonuclease
VGEAAHKQVTDEDGIVRLHDVSWADFEHLLRMRGEHSAPRLAYLEGEVEIMSPSRSHESIKGTIGRLVEVYCLENDIEFGTYGSWTLKKKSMRRGGEPDECYLFGGQNRSWPDLAIEVEWTSGRIDKLDIYRKLGVREVWYWREGQLDAYRLHGERYRHIAASKALPGIDLGEIAALLESVSTSQAIRQYRAGRRR